ncbi:hypothetical protein ABIB90_007135 [Bradyrhizobium sp. JR4.1]|uniref:hypothetical protein n=1 Tax=Bradyrhizobium sp. JR4.1 TaxID=3156372 RepID=UPI003394D0EA
MRATFTSAIREFERKPDCTTVSMPHADEIRVNGVAYVSGDEACRLLDIKKGTLNGFARKSRWAQVWNVRPAGEAMLTVYYLKQYVLRYQTNRRERRKN